MAMTAEEQAAYDKMKADLEKAQAEKKESEAYKADMLKFKDEKAAALKKLEEIENSNKSEIEKKMLAEKQYEELVAIKNKELEAEKEKTQRLTQGYIKSKVNEAILTEALSQGLDPAAKDLLLLLPQTGVNPAFTYAGDGSAQVNVTGVKEHIAALVASKPMLFKKPKGPGVRDLPSNSGILPTTGEEVTVDQLANWRNSGKPEEKAKYDEYMKTVYAEMPTS